MQTSQWRRNSSDLGERGRGSKQNVTKVPPHCSVLCYGRGWTCQRWAWQEGCGEIAMWCVISLALLGPALCQRTSPFLPCGDGVRSSTSTVGSALIKCISFPSDPHFTLHLTQSPVLEIESGIRDHWVFFIRRNSSLSRKILHRESVVDF